MKKYTELELKDILEKHSLWLKRDPNGVRANLSGANLRGANLREANLYGANLSGADISEADLRGANLSRTDLSGTDISEANLYGANLNGADISEANLYGANLREADLYGANLREADLYGANLSGADISEANLRGANLREADLYGANLYGANLREADLSGANLYGANLSGAKHINCPMACPEKGSFIGFKKVCGDLIVELEITADALRSSATGRKCRCSKAKVLSITNIDGTESDIDSARSLWDPDFAYTVGETIEVSNFDTNRCNECAPGIHFFITRQEAVDFNMW